jgi:hypothetical protein
LNLLSPTQCSTGKDHNSFYPFLLASSTPSSLLNYASRTISLKVAQPNVFKFRALPRIIDLISQQSGELSTQAKSAFHKIVKDRFDSLPNNLNGDDGFAPSVQCQLVSIRAENSAVKDQWVWKSQTETRKH